MKSTGPVIVATVVAVVAGSVLLAQRGQAPELMACGLQDDLEVICGTQAPEDLEVTPDGEYLIVSQFNSEGLALFDPDSDSFTPLSITSDRRTGWGDLACPGPMTEALSSHGTSLGVHPDGTPSLYVVNHGGRETIEMFELREVDDSYALVWHGCVVGAADYNDVAILPDGGYVATRPTALREEGGGESLVDGEPSGNVARWTSGTGEMMLPGTEAGFPNGVVADADGAHIYIASWTGRGLRKYDLEGMREVAAVDLDFMPDNLTWTPDGALLAAGIRGFGGQGGFRVAEIDPDSLDVRPVYESDVRPTPITGVSVAIEVDGAIYVGAFQGDRLIRLAP